MNRFAIASHGAVGRTYLIAATLSVVISLSFFNTVLVADEVFVVFSFGPELLAAPSKIISWAFSSSAGGWSTGRFISPLSHIISNTGVFLNEVTANVLSINQIQAYSLWRVVMLVALSLSIMKLVHLLMVGAQVNQRTITLVMALASVVIPAGYVTNRAFSAIRMQTWSYGIFTLVAIWLMISLISIAIHWQNSSRARSLKYLMVATFALLFATTYELTQTLAPVALFVANYYLWNLRKDEVTSLNKIKSALLTKFNLVFLAFFAIPFLIIRIDSFAKCASGCYQAASLNPGGFSPGDFFSRTVSSIPTIAQVVGFGYETSWLESGFNLAALAGASTVSLIATLWLLNSLRKSDLPKKETLDVSGLKILALTGLAIILVISIGMALSVAVQTSQDKLSFGASSRDSLILSIGTDLLLSYIFAVCGIKIISSKKIKSPTRALLSVFMVTALSANFALTFVSNSIVTRATQSSAGAFMQGAIATAASHPDTTAQGDQLRCLLVKQKILNFPEWEGHDRLLVNGLNQNFQTKTGGNFCSISIEELFENYPLK